MINIHLSPDEVVDDLCPLLVRLPASLALALSPALEGLALQLGRGAVKHKDLMLQ